MRKLTSILICIIFIYSCNTEKKNIGFKSSYTVAKLNQGMEDLIYQYFDSSSKLEENKFVLGLTVHHYTENHYMILLDNIPKSQMGYDKKLGQTWRLCYVDGFMVYIYDLRNKISEPTHKKTNVYYEKLNDSIIPSGYEGNNWELHFKNDTLEKLYLGWTSKSLNEKIEQNIRQINFSNNLNILAPE